jgi:hypothetical protein
MIWKERMSAHERLLTTEAGERTDEKHGTRHSHKFVESTTIDANRGSNKQTNKLTNMTVPHAIAVTYRELYSEPANNPFGLEEAGKDSGYEAVYEVWRETSGALEVDVLLQNILADCSRTIGGIGVFVLDGTSSSGVLEVLHGVSIYPGVPGKARDCMKIFASLGDVEGVDVATVAFDSKQLSITLDVLVPGSINRTLQLLVN